MATTTPNFGWPVPTSTDLVKDGATAIEALGDAIDASLVDLEGGTTGQILAKASNTDMDFTWITNDVGDITAVSAGTGISGGGTSGAVTITNSMATEIAAKGDLIVGTGSQTFDNLTAGANDLLLTAASGEATGLKYTGGWTSYTPSYYTGVTVGNGTVVSRYQKIGKIVNLYWSFTLGSTSAFGTGGTVIIPLPVNAIYETWSGSVVYTDAGVQNYVGNLQIDPAFQLMVPKYGSVSNNATATSPFTFGTGDKIFIYASYEVA